jgi:hypothetical protein
LIHNLWITKIALIGKRIAVYQTKLNKRYIEVTMENKIMAVSHFVTIGTTELNHRPQVSQPR